MEDWLEETEEKSEEESCSECSEYLAYIEKLSQEIEQDIQDRESKAKFFGILLANVSSASFALLALELGLNWYSSALTGLAIGLLPLWFKFEEMKKKEENDWKDWAQLGLQGVIPLGVAVRLVYEKKQLEWDFNAIKYPVQHSPLSRSISVLSFALFAVVVLRLVIKRREEWE